MCSRREADFWISQGWVRVNGLLASMGLQVLPADKIEVERAAHGYQATQVTFLINKPMGYVSGQAEDGHSPAVSLINAHTQWQGDTSKTRFQWAQLQGLAPAGRLDIDSIGLLVLTQDGRVARQIIGEQSDIEKEYLVRVEHVTHARGASPATHQVLEFDSVKPVAPLEPPHQRTQSAQRGDEPQAEAKNSVRDTFAPAQLARLRHGLSLDGAPLLPAVVEWQNADQLRFVLREGKKRQIRRMCEQVGLKVIGLKRIRIGNIVLGNLPIGQWRFLAPNEHF